MARKSAAAEEEKWRLNQTLTSHLNNIHETFQVLDGTPSSLLEKVSWDEVVKLGDQVSKQATIVGMLWTGESPKAKAVEENMETFFNTLQGFLLVSHGSKVGAGPTLSSAIDAVLKQVVDSSFKLMMETVSLYGSRNKDMKLSVPQLVGAVWEACSALKKAPATNITAIGRAMTQVAVSVKDVLREMNELKPASSSDPMNKSVDCDSSAAETTNCDDDDSSESDLGSDLSPEEMKVAQLAIMIVSETVAVIKELIRSITGLIKLERPEDSGNFVDTLERLLKSCQEIGLQVDELGASLYPPQEIPIINASLQKISIIVSEVQVDVESVKSSSEAFFQACNSLRSSIEQMESEVKCSSTADVEARLQSVTIGN